MIIMNLLLCIPADVGSRSLSAASRTKLVQMIRTEFTGNNLCTPFIGGGSSSRSTVRLNRRNLPLLRRKWASDTAKLAPYKLHFYLRLSISLPPTNSSFSIPPRFFFFSFFGCLPLWEAITRFANTFYLSQVIHWRRRTGKLIDDDDDDDDAREGPIYIYGFGIFIYSAPSS